MNTVDVFMKFFTKLQLSAQRVLLRVVSAEVEQPGTQLSTSIDTLVGGSLIGHMMVMHGLVVYEDTVDDFTQALTVHELTNGDDGLRVIDCHVVDEQLVFGVAAGPMQSLLAEHGPAVLALMNRVIVTTRADQFT